MKINISFDQTALKQAFKQHYDTKYPFKSRMMLIFGVLTTLLGLGMFFFDFPKNPEYLKHIIVFAGVVYVLLYFYRRKKLYERAAAQKTFEGNFTFELNNKGLTFGKDDKVSKCAWAQVEEILQDENNILFYFGKDKFYILPLKNVSKEKQTEIQEIIKKYYGK